MKIAGIICEYNPFHLGHARQLHLLREQTGSNTAVVCVMSGNFVQRGAPALFDKFTRAQSAVACGTDLVLELPVTGALQSAEGFAETGVQILSALGCVDYLCFGAECGSSKPLMALAQRMNEPGYEGVLRKGLQTGLPYHTATQQALNDQSGILTHPNNILGLEYCRAICRLNSSLTPLAIHRRGDYHTGTADASEPSATAVRALFPHGTWKQFVPPEAASVLSDVPYYRFAFGERAVLARLRGMTDDQWNDCAHGSEGLWSKAMKAVRSCQTYESIRQTVKSKRYPMTRIDRLLICAYLGFTADDLLRPIPYVRILAASANGRQLLRRIKKETKLPLINPGETPPDLDYYALETRAADLFTLFSAPNLPCPCRTEQSARLLI